MEKTSHVSIGVLGLGRMTMARWMRCAALLVTACVLSTAQAHAAVIYSVSSVIATGNLSLSHQFSVTSSDFIDTATQLTPSASGCTVPSNPIIVSCEVGPNVILFPGMFIGFDANNLPGYFPSRIDWAVSITGFNGSTFVTVTQSKSAIFGFPYTVGGTSLQLPGTYPGIDPFTGAGVALVTVSGSPDDVTSVPEPTSLLLVGSGALGVLARMRRRNKRSACVIAALAGGIGEERLQAGDTETHCLRTWASVDLSPSKNTDTEPGSPAFHPSLSPSVNCLTSPVPTLNVY